MVQILIGLLVVLLLYYLFYLVKDIYKNRSNLKDGNYFIAGIIGFVTDFLDTLGIGSFAPTTMLFKFTKFLKNDRILPATLNTSHTVPVITQAIIFITVVEVAPVTLFSLVIAALVGSWIGSKTVAKLPESKIQTFVGIALIVTAIFMALKQVGALDMLGTDNTDLGLTGVKLIIGIVGNLVLGALMTIGVGLYAPCMALVYFLGLSPLVAFPIMMASCASLMPVASAEFIKSGEYSRAGTIGITIGGMLGVFVAVKFVTNMDLNILTWVIVLVVTYTGITYLLKGLKKQAKA